MKIQNEAGNPAAPLSGDTKVAKLSREVRAGKTFAATEQTTADSIETSAISQNMGADPARLEQLREAVRNGTYIVPAQDISANLIDEHLNKHS